MACDCPTVIRLAVSRFTHPPSSLSGAASCSKKWPWASPLGDIAGCSDMAYTVADDIALDAFGAWQMCSRSARGGGSARAAAAPRFREARLRYLC